MADDETNPRKRDYQLWCSRIRKMRKLREDWEKSYKVEKCAKFYLGDQWHNEKGPRVMNHYLATIRATLPNLLFDNPKPIVRPRPGHEQEARIKAAVGENTLSQIMNQDDNFANAASLGLLQALWRIGVLKVIYDPKLEPNPSYAGPDTPKMAYDKDGNPIADQSGQPQPLINPRTGKMVVEPQFIVSDETYRWEWINGADMLLPDAGPDSARWPYIGQEITVSLGEAKEDERFPEALRNQFKSNVEPEKKKRVKTRSKKGDEDEFEEDQLFKYVECYDMRHRRWYCIAEDQEFDEFLIDESVPDGIEDHPYAILAGFLPITDPEPSPWPLPYTFSWLDPQEEYNIRREQQMEGAKRSARKVGYDEGTFDSAEEAIKALQSSRDMEAVKLRDVMRPWIVVQDPGPPPNISQEVPYLLNDYRVIAGQPSAKLGTPDADTATEAAIVQRNSDLRDSDLQKAVAKWLKTALRKMFQLVRKTMTVSMFVKIRGMEDKEVQQFIQSRFGIAPEMLVYVPELKNYVIQTFGQERVEPITRETLEFEADIEVLPGSTRPRSLTSERAQFLEVLKIIAQFPQILLSRLLIEELFRKYEFVNPALIDELQVVAQQMMMATQTTAGRGGQNTATENTPGEGPGPSAQAMSLLGRMAA